jgi:hypothetical protein
MVTTHADCLSKAHLCGLLDEGQIINIRGFPREMEDSFVKARFHLVGMFMMGALMATLIGCGQKDAAENKEAPVAEAPAEAVKAEEVAKPVSAMPGLAQVPHIGSDDPKVVILESSDFQ